MICTVHGDDFKLPMNYKPGSGCPFMMPKHWIDDMTKSTAPAPAAEVISRDAPQIARRNAANIVEVN
jgi:hypothetical protein